MNDADARLGPPVASMLARLSPMLVNMHEAKSRLSELVRLVADGHEVIIGRNGDPVARLVPYRDRAVSRRPGRLRGKIQMAADFDVTPDDVLDAFEGTA